MDGVLDGADSGLRIVAPMQIIAHTDFQNHASRRHRHSPLRFPIGTLPLFA
jgi:hypothetical protein